MNTWLYDEKPWLQLEYEKSLKNIKSALETDYFERLIEDKILNNSHSSLLILKPKKGLASEKEKEERIRLTQYKEQLSEEEINTIIF